MEGVERATAGFDFGLGVVVAAAAAVGIGREDGQWRSKRGRSSREHARVKSGCRGEIEVRRIDGDDEECGRAS